MLTKLGIKSPYHDLQGKTWSVQRAENNFQTRSDTTANNT